MKHRHIDWILILFSLAVMTYSGRQLFFSPEKNQTSSGESIAELGITESDVRRRSQNDLAWGEARVGDHLENNDWIYVHKNSSASLFYLSGMRTNLSETTLIKLEGKRSAPVIILNKGEVSTNFSQTASILKVKIDGKIVEINSSSGQIDLSKNDKELNVKIISGFATITQEDGKKQKLKSLEQLNLNLATGEVEKTEMAMGMVSPLPGSTFWVPSFPITQKLIWLGEVNVLFDNKKFEGQSKEWEVEIPQEGSYAWEIRSLKSEKENIKTNLYYKEVKSPEIIKPFEGQVFIPTSSSMDLSVDWLVPSDDFLKFELEKSNGEIVNLGQAPSLVSFALGDQKIRMRSIVSGVIGAWSNWRSFSLNVPPMFKLKNFSPERSNYEINFYTEENRDDFKINFNWEWDGELGKLAIVEVDERNIQSKQIVSDLSWTWSNKKFGKYILNFYVNDPWGRESEFNKEVVVSLNDRRADILKDDYSILKVELKRPDQVVAFKWDDPEEVAFVLAKDPEFKDKIIEKKIKNGATQLSVPDAGTFYWQTKNLNGSKSYSKPVKVEVYPAPPPVKPNLEKEIKLKLQKQVKHSLFKTIFNLMMPEAMADDEFVQLKWNEKEDIKNYLIQIFKDSKAEKIILESKTDKTLFNWTGVAPGVYYWRLSYVDYWNRQGPWSELSKIVVEGDQEIDLIHPGNLSDVNSIPFELKWGKALGAKNYEWFLKKDKVVVESGKTKQTFVVIENELPKGKYHWFVKSENAISKERKFDYSSDKFINSDKKIEVENKNFASFLFSPTMVKMSADSTDSNIQSNGSTLNSLSVNGRHEQWRYLALRAHGKFQTGHKWDELKMNLRKGKAWGKFSLMADVQILQLTYLSYSSSSYQQKKSSLFSIGPWLEWSMTPQVSLEFGFNVGSNITYGSKFWWRSKKGPTAGVSYIKHNFKNSGSSVSYTEQQLYLGWTHVY